VQIGVARLDFVEFGGHLMSRILRYPSPMHVSKMLLDLRQERDRIDEAIIVLERLAQGRGKRRGRPPGWLKTLRDAPKRRGRPPGSKNKD
jgi:hypothetical protein